MKFVVIGSGQMGSAIGFDLARSPDVELVALADLNLETAQRSARSIGSKKVRAIQLDAADHEEVVRVMSHHDCAIGATIYRDNVSLTKAALRARVHFCDLGGNDEVVREQMSFHEEAVAAGLCIVPNCGLAPGFANVLAARGAEFFEKVDSIHIRVGGLPQHPRPPFMYQLMFSVEGLINEYTGKSYVLRNFKIEEVDTLTETESLAFPAPFNQLEAFHTSGGASFLPDMFQGKVRTLDYKTIRYPGHCEKFKTLLDLGFASNEPLSMGSNIIVAKEIFYELLKKKLSGTDHDVVLMRVSIKGLKDHKSQTLSYELVDYFDEINNITAMMRTTAYPTSVIAQLIVKKLIRDVGVLLPERCVPLDPLLQELSKRGIEIVHKESE